MFGRLPKGSSRTVLLPGIKTFYSEGSFIVVTGIHFRVFLSVLLLVIFLVPTPMPVAADDKLPDGCLGNLNDNQVIVYYFHRKFRCQSCEVLESTLEKTLMVTYSEHFGAGRLAMCVVNVDNPVNRHYLEKFEIFTNSVVIVEKRGGNVLRYEAVESIWDAPEDKDAISQLLRTAVDGFLPES